jgi:trk system potassium uptake protein TrkH
MELRIIAKTAGGLIVILGILLCLPTLFSLMTGGEYTQAFSQTVLIALAAGGALWWTNRNCKAELNHRTGFAVVAVSWLSACLLGALPYYFSGALPEFLNALFESTSGFSGTGASVIANVEEVRHELLLWRSMTQWLGGMGIIVFFIAILPALGLGGVQLYKAEITGPGKDKITPRVRETARKLWLLYVAFTVLLAIILSFSGMNSFDAINHALTTLSTGGFSTRAAGIKAFNSPLIEYVILSFMFLSSVNFALHYRFLILRDREALFGTELKWYVCLVVLASLSLTFSIWHPDHFPDFEPALRSALFTVTCTVSSTGFTGYDYIDWPYFSHAVILCLMVMGGMSGSTAGGVKCIRIVTMIKQILKELAQSVHPSAMLTLKTDRHSMQARIQSTIWGFLFIYFFSVVFVVLIMTFDGNDLITSSTAAISALSNIGPGLGDLGPYSNYAELSALSKSTLCAAMLLGRLEFYTVLVLITPEFWRK